VGTDGSVEKVDIVKGNALLTAAASAAAKEWKFTPFKVDGAPAKAVFRLAFDFAQ
jgi:outer membrane biosynthesis protein TonB